MKKILACTVAALLAGSMMTACGSEDDTTSSTATTTTTTTAAESTEESTADESTEDSAAESTADESAADAESTADESAADAESGTDESAADGEDGEGDEEAEQPKDISEMPATLADLDTASLTFDTSMDPADFVKCMAENDWEGTDESHCDFSIEEVEGIPMLRVQVLDLNDAGTAYKIPKIQFDMTKLFAGQTDNIGKVFTIEIEFMTKAVGTFVNEDDGTEALVPGNFMGELVSQTGTDPDNLSWNELGAGIGDSEWTSEWGTYKYTVRPGIMGAYESTDSVQYFTFMRWSIPNQADFYIADITFKDEDGNVLPCSIGTHAAE
jgi:hypothetical protein